jgi:hypothetical protein
LGEGIPLAAAIDTFNESSRRNPIGMHQPPLNQEEVIAAIRWWSTRREQVPLTDADFNTFQAIATTRRIPKQAEFEVLTGFQPNETHYFDAWSVRIRLTRSDGTGSYAFIIRDRWLRVREIDERSIAWGPKGANGLQAGILFEPSNEQYFPGQRVTPRFYFRNAGSTPLSVAFPRLMTRSYYEAIRVVDDAGAEIAIDQQSGLSGPVGWIRTQLSPGSQHDIVGRPIVIGKVARGAGDETAIHAAPGQSCRVRFTFCNFADTASPHIETGDVAFTVANEVRR